jgi:hypothetical protein
MLRDKILNQYNQQLPAANVAGDYAFDIEVPVGAMRYGRFDLDLSCGAVALPAYLKKVELISGETVFRTITPSRYQSELLSLADDGSDRWAIQNYNVAGATASLPIYFHEPWRSTPGTRNLGLLGTADLKRLRIRLTFFGSLSAQPALVARAEFDNVAQNAGRVLHVIEDNVPTGGSLVPQYDGFTVRGPFESISIFEAQDANYLNVANTITQVDFLRTSGIGEDEIIKEITKAQLDRKLTRHCMTPQADSFQIVFDTNDDVLGEAQPNAFRLSKVKLTTSSATARTLIAVSKQIAPMPL